MALVGILQCKFIGDAALIIFRRGQETRHGVTQSCVYGAHCRDCRLQITHKKKKSHVSSIHGQSKALWQQFASDPNDQKYYFPEQVIIKLCWIIGMQSRLAIWIVLK